MAFLEQVWLDLSRRTVLYPLEAAVFVAALLLFLLFGRKFSWFAYPRRLYLEVARRKRLTLLIVLILGFLGHLIEPHYVAPPPGFHDEFSYLLAADTFASGRLTNPPHPMRFFFESIHILVEPTYMSMYPPGQGMILAVGLVLGGSAIMGVWLSAALCCASLCWMLQGWTTPGWALAGGLIAVARIGWFSYWAHSYWGGALAAFGGALVFGAIPRLMRRPTVGMGCVYSAGALVLINTRLFEGTVLLVTVTIWLGVALWKHKRDWARLFIVPALILVAGICWMAFYNWRITGSPVRPPYLQSRTRYETYGSFVWQKEHTERQYDHEAIGRFYRETEGYTRTLPYWQVQLEKPVSIWFFFIGPALTLPLLFSLGSIRNPALRPLWLSLVIGGLAHTVVMWRLQPHYAAPLTGAIYILVVVGLRRMMLWRRHKRIGLQIQRAVLATCAAMILLRVGAPSLGLPVFQEVTLPWYSYGLGANFNRSKLEERLTKMEGQHLVLVQYAPNHSPEEEWVYNRADIDGAPVVWARYVADRERLQPLLDYFRDRKIWIVFPDQRPNQIFDFREHYR